LTFRGLSEREVRVLRLLADGMDTAEVGRELFYSERTVKNIVHDITSRLELRNRTHAVAYAIKQGLI
jgi:DNA-binding NarL/FixJ family response regulator